MYFNTPASLYISVREGPISTVSSGKPHSQNEPSAITECRSQENALARGKLCAALEESSANEAHCNNRSAQCKQRISLEIQ
jgi:hypothetical protein